MEASNVYVCFYLGERKELHASSQYEAKKLACMLWKVPSKKEYKVSAVLAEKKGKTVTHVADF